MLLAEGGMTISLRLVDSYAKISNDINIAIAKYINTQFNKNKNTVLNQIRRSIPIWLLESPEIQSLSQEGIEGSLNAQFGITRGTSLEVIDQITNAVSKSIYVEIKPVTKKLTDGGIYFYIQPSDFKNLLQLPAGFILRDTYSLHWLQWLLLEGTKTVVFGYTYAPDNTGVSGGGTMTSGGVWRVPPQFAGNANDNFITRVLLGRDRELAVILQGMFK